MNHRQCSLVSGNADDNRTKQAGEREAGCRTSGGGTRNHDRVRLKKMTRHVPQLQQIYHSSSCLDL